MSRRNDPFHDSYSHKLGFYIGILALPLILMALVETFAASSSISVSSGDPTRFAAFLVYFLPGLVITRNVTHSWRRTIGVGIAYALISSAYYLGALQFACNFGGNCVSI